jgi:hypothetical protein
VLVNGQRHTIAGANAAETIEATVLTYPGMQQSWLRVTGDIVSKEQPKADAEWLAMQLSVGDHIEVRLIESDNPGAPKLSRTDPTLPASDEIPFVCAFCGKDAHQTGGMVASRKAMICHDCIGYLHDMIGEADTEPAA